MHLWRVRLDFFQTTHGNLLRNMYNFIAQSVCKLYFILKYWFSGWLNSEHFNKDDFVASHRSDPSFQMFAEKLIQVQMFEQYVTMKEDKRRKFEGRDGFDTGKFSTSLLRLVNQSEWAWRKTLKVISNLPELKSNLDALKKFGVGLLEKGKKEIQNKNKQLRKEFEKNRKWFLN